MTWLHITLRLYHITTCQLTMLSTITSALCFFFLFCRVHLKPVACNYTKRNRARTRAQAYRPTCVPGAFFLYALSYVGKVIFTQTRCDKRQQITGETTQLFSRQTEFVYTCLELFCYNSTAYVVLTADSTKVRLFRHK